MSRLSIATSFMKRRKFIQYGAIGSSAFFANIALLNYEQASIYGASVNSQKLYDWIILYWMPYDNNLSRFGTPILEMLAKGVQSDRILVAVESKLSGERHLSRHLISKGNVALKKIDATDSSSEEVFAEYLNWAKSQFQAKKWAIAFLGHGGRLDEISPDEHPQPGAVAVTKWMNIQKLSDIISKFNKQVDDRLELVFFQNCNKGTIEAHYTFRDTAKYTLSSQMQLGVPNYYYEPLLQFLGDRTEVNGGELAKKIMEFERSDMYHSYTVTYNPAVSNLPATLNPLIDAVIASGTKAIKTSDLKTYSYMGDRFVDVVSFFQAIAQQSGAEQQYKNFLTSLNNSIVYGFKQNGILLGPNARYYKNLSGLGMLLPKSRQDIDKYRYLPVFSDLRLVELFNTILFN